MLVVCIRRTHVGIYSARITERRLANLELTGDVKGADATTATDTRIIRKLTQPAAADRFFLQPSLSKLSPDRSSALLTVHEDDKRLAVALWRHSLCSLSRQLGLAPVLLLSKARIEPSRHRQAKL